MKKDSKLLNMFDVFSLGLGGNWFWDIRITWSRNCIHWAIHRSSCIYWLCIHVICLRLQPRCSINVFTERWNIQSKSLNVQC